MTRHDPAISRSKTGSPHFRAVLQERLSRRDVLKGGIAAIAATAVAPGFAGSIFGGDAIAGGAQSSLTFSELKRVYDQTHHVAPGYNAEVLLRWGDKLSADAPSFDAAAQTAESQNKQFGYNNDFVGYLPLPLGSGSSDHGLLCVNHEYPNPHVMFPGLVAKDDEEMHKLLSEDQIAVNMACVGHSVVEIIKKEGKWSVVENSPYNRRITALTEMAIAGPAAGHDMLKTSADPSGTKVKGTMANCGGGYTPWGTILTCEEFAYEFFGGDPAKTNQKDHLERLGFEGTDYYGFARVDEPVRRRKGAERTEPLPVGHRDRSLRAELLAPVKRTALGRMGHEGSTVVVNKDGRVVVYMGDDDHREYLFRFVSAKPFNATDRKANIGILDEGELAVAKFESDGRSIGCRWFMGRAR